MAALKPGDKVMIDAKSMHPWCGHKGILLEFKEYGPAFRRMKGWLVSLDGQDRQCFTSADCLKVIK